MNSHFHRGFFKLNSTQFHLYSTKSQHALFQGTWHGNIETWQYLEEIQQFPQRANSWWQWWVETPLWTGWTSASISWARRSSDVVCLTALIFKRDYDDINDVASMAGVNISEESANILASNSGLVGAVTRSCKDEPFLSCSLLQKRMLEIGETLQLEQHNFLFSAHPIIHFQKHRYCAVSFPGSKYGVTSLGAEVVNLVSHATQQRLQNLVENVSHVAQQRNINFKVCLQL